jgi:DNA-binding CsgD family transcriptional regulator
MEAPLRIEDLRFDCRLTNREIELLAMITAGNTDLRIAWVMETSLAVVENLRRSLEYKLDTTRLAEAGALLEARGYAPEHSPAKELAQAILQPLTGARILYPVCEGDFAGLKMVLRNGMLVTAWIVNKVDGEFGGWVDLEDADYQSIWLDDIRQFAEHSQTALASDARPADCQRAILEDIAERAITLLDEIDGDPDLEWETDLDVNPVELNTPTKPPLERSLGIERLRLPEGREDLAYPGDLSVYEVMAAIEAMTVHLWVVDERIDESPQTLRNAHFRKLAADISELKAKAERHGLRERMRKVEVAFAELLDKFNCELDAQATYHPPRAYAHG